MLTNYHTHTTRCGHAEGTEEEYILTALRCGFKVLGFSDHTPWAYATPGFVSRIRMLPSQLDDYVLTCAAAGEICRQTPHPHRPRGRVFPGLSGLAQRRDGAAGHRISHPRLPLRHHRRAGRQGQPLRRQPLHRPRRRYAEQVVEALETGLYRYLAHPDLFLNRVTAFDADAEKACRDICAAAARLDIPLEYNMAGLTLQGRPDGSLATPGTSSGTSRGVPRQGHRGCDAHAPSELDVVPAIEEKKAFLHSLGIPVLDTCRGWNKRPLCGRAASAILRQEE